MNRADIAAVLAEHPLLNDFGIGLFDRGRGLSKEQKDETLSRDREALLDSEADCTRVCEWLGRHEKTKTINRRHSSYTLKHLMARQTGKYVTNGVFITAAIHSGFPFKIFPDDPNVCLGISERSLKGVGAS
jgi:hypothetical protein